MGQEKVLHIYSVPLFLRPSSKASKCHLICTELVIMCILRQHLLCPSKSGIEELNKTPNGNVEAKVMCYFRRRDIPASLLVLADKHQGIIEPEPEVNGTEPHSPSVKPAASPSTTNQETSSEPAVVKPESEEET